MPSDTCTHLDLITTTAANTDGCEDCLAMGGRWLHLRRCATCGHVGCCDSSPNRHATKHVGQTQHQIVQSFEPGEDWFWCYADELAFELDSNGPSPSHQ